MAGRSEKPCCDHLKPFQDWCKATEPFRTARISGSDPEALDELEEMDAMLYQTDTGISIYVSSGRFDTQFCVKRLSEMMTKPRKLGNLRIARLARHLVGTPMSRRTRRHRSGCSPERALDRQDTSKFDGYGSKTPFVTKLCV